MTHAIVPYGGDGIERARGWATLPDDERRRRAVAAARDHDVETLCELADVWLTLHGKAGAAVSPLTRSRYRTCVRGLVDDWRQESLLRPRRNAGVLYARSLQAAGWRPSTVTVRLSAARTLYAALRWTGATDADPFRDVKGAVDPVPPWERRKPYRDDEIAALLAAATIEDRALVLLGAHAGLRAAEMVALQWSDIDLIRGELVVRRGKGGKQRTVPLSGSLAAALQALEPADANGYVLPYRTRVTAWQRLDNLARKVGVVPKGLHSLRHSAGTRLVRESGDLERAARHLGHSSLETTRIYAKWSDESLRAQVGEW